MKDENPTGPYFRTQVAANYIGSTKSSLEKMRFEGTGPEYIKLNRIVVYAKADLDAFLAGLKRRSTSSQASPAPATA